jgi:FMN phosphatase YigB (HAD superfamily)
MGQIDQIIFDVDDVAVDTDAAVKAGAEAVDPRIRAAFHQSYQTLIAHLRGENPPAYGPLRRRIEQWQRELNEVKQWSRECLIAIALEDAGVEPTFAEVEQSARAYWRVVTEKTVVYPDHAELQRKLEARGIGVYYATNSDGFLRFDDAKRTFAYDAADSARRKIERLSLLRPFGMSEDTTTVGDPVGKPHAAFYEKALRDFDRSRTLVVGDSLTADVLPFLKAGVKHGVWLRRHGGGSESGVPAIRSLLELEAML